MINLTKVIAALLVLCALALGGYAWWLGRQPAPAPVTPLAATAPPAKTHALVVTSRAVVAGEPLTSASVRIEYLPINPPDALRDLAAATGRVPVANLGEGTPVMESQLASGLALRLEEGERAVAIKADEVMGVGNRVRPGDFVDVFFVVKTEGREIERSQARLLLSRQRVLAFGAASVDGIPDGESAKTPVARAEPARTAVLAVPVQDVARLALGESGGRLLLALRNPGDHAVPDTSLFAELPPALPPLPARPGMKRNALAPLDLAQAGLNLTDLANGPGGVNAGIVRTASPAVPIATSTSPAPSRPRAANGSDVRSGTEVEVFRGDKRETLSY